MEGKLEKLLLEKPFSILSIDEKEYVLSQISESEYNKFHFLLLASKNSYKEEYDKITINNHIKEALNVAFKKRHKKQIFKNIHLNEYFQKNYYKPAFAFAVIIVLCVIFFFKHEKNNDSTIREVTTFLLEQKTHHITDSLKNNFYEMNKYMMMRTQGIDAGFEQSEIETSSSIN
ncbi:MAG: hypothetical protein ACM31G_00535 [Flavobacteriales bacterium]